MTCPKGQSALAEEELLERLEQLLAAEGPDPLAGAVVLGDAAVVLEGGVRGVERVLQLEALPDVVVAARLEGGPMLGIDDATHGPDGAGAALDPDHDALG